MLVLHYIVRPDQYVRLLLRPDLPPVAYFPYSREVFAFEHLTRWGVMISPPPGPLGLRPIWIQPNLIECWLPEEEWDFWKGSACFDPRGWQLVERIEDEILKLEAGPDFSSLLIESEITPATAKAR